MKRIRISTIARMALGANLILAWLATACAPSSTPTQPIADVESTSTSQSQEGNPGENAPPTKPAVSPDLHATDPDTVSLASGKVQLVEFFAYW